jgi:dTDP-4-dehydrorhamnose reductase
MRIFISGGSGLMGSKVAELATRRSHDVFSGYAEHPPELGEGIKYDLTDAKSIARAIRTSEPDIIIHTAALTDVDRCEIDKDLAFKANVLGTKALAEAAKVAGAFILYTSTDYVFDGSKGMYKEDDPTNPMNYYGLSKLLGEAYCDSVARACVIYGAKPARGKINFALWIIESLVKGQRIKLVTDQYVTPTLNTNLAEMVLEVAERKLPGIYHLAGATRISRYDYAVDLARAFGLDGDLITKSKTWEMEWAALRPLDSSLDTSKAAAHLTAKPLPLGEALKALRSELC